MTTVKISGAGEANCPITDLRVFRHFARKMLLARSALECGPALRDRFCVSSLLEPPPEASFRRLEFGHFFEKKFLTFYTVEALRGLRLGLAAAAAATQRLLGVGDNSFCNRSPERESTWDR